VSSSSKDTTGVWVTFDCHEDAVFVPSNNWVGFDLDGTLARTDNPGHFEPPYPIGEPIPEMIALAQKILAAGVRVKIFTARACEFENVAIVQQWTDKHGLGRLEVTNQKDYNMIRYYDDRAIQMQLNSGKSIAAVWSERFRQNIVNSAGA
jgi:hypothetical protein